MCIIEILYLDAGHIYNPFVYIEIYPYTFDPNNFNQLSMALRDASDHPNAGNC